MYHAGVISTFSSRLALLPEAQVAVYLATNGPGPSKHTKKGMDALMMHLLDLASGLEPWLTNVDGLCTYPTFWIGDEPTVPITMTPQDLEQKLVNEEVMDDIDLHAYEGSFVHPDFGVIYISVSSSDGHLHFRWGRLGQGKLYRIVSQDQAGAVAFQVLWGAPYTYDIKDRVIITFNETNEDGVVSAFGIVQGSSVYYFTRDSLFEDHEWICPDIDDMGHISGSPTLVVVNRLQWIIPFSAIICTHIRWY